MTRAIKSRWAACAVCVWLFASPSDAFVVIRDDRRLGTAVFSSNQQQSFNSNFDNSNNNGYGSSMSNGYNDNGYGANDAGRERFKMVKQFNGDYKTVPIDEYYDQTTRRSRKQQRSVASEYGVLRATRGSNPNLTSPAREMLSKQWEWQRPPPQGMRPRFRQVETFSGDVKTVREDENPYLDGRVLKNQYGRVDGTGYVPDMGPESASMLRYAPSRQRQGYGEPPRGPPMYGPPLPPPRGPPMYPPPPPPPRARSRQSRRRDYEARRREVDPRFVGDEFRREMRKYRRDDYDDYYEEDEEYFYDDGRDRGDPLKTLAKEAEKVIKSVTSVGGPYTRKDRRQRKRDMNYLRRASAGGPRNDMMYPPPPPPDMRYGGNFYGGEGRRRVSDDRDGNVAGSYASSKAVRSFEQQGNGYYGPRPPYQGRQYGSSRYQDDSYDNPAARTEQGRPW